MSGFIHHISITCTDIKRSQSFYQRLGFEPYKMYEDDGCIITLMKGENGDIELFHFKLAENITHCNANQLEKIGLTHIALKTTHLEKMKASLIHDGYKCQESRKARLGGFSYFFTADPDGNLVEFIEE